jgi:hypothetical protein
MAAELVMPPVINLQQQQQQQGLRLQRLLVLEAVAEVAPMRALCNHRTTTL